MINFRKKIDSKYIAKLTMDPWVITPQERARHMDQFSTTNPVDGFITGAQAKGFFMQSGLPPMVLAQIWYIVDICSEFLMTFFKGVG